jgi:hypothetical protein
VSDTPALCVESGDGQDRAPALGWEMICPTDLRPPPALTPYHKKLRMFQSVAD